jgi:hypothetical protein
MNYPNGEKIKVGDRLKLWDGCTGVVVCSIDDNEYTESYTKDNWEYLNEGILINSDAAGLIHYTEPEDAFLLIKRATINT